MISNHQLFFGQNLHSQNSVCPQDKQQAFQFQSNSAFENANLSKLLMPMNSFEPNIPSLNQMKNQIGLNGIQNMNYHLPLNTNFNQISNVQNKQDMSILLNPSQQILQEQLQLQQPLLMNNQFIQPVLSTQSLPSQIYLSRAEEQNKLYQEKILQPAQFINGRPQNMIIQQQQQSAIAFQQQQKLQQLQNQQTLQQNLFNLGSNNLIGSYTTIGSYNDLPLAMELLNGSKQLNTSSNLNNLSINASACSSLESISPQIFIEKLQQNQQMQQASQLKQSDKLLKRGFENTKGNLKIEKFGANPCKYLKTEESQSQFSDKTIQLGQQQSPIIIPFLQNNQIQTKQQNIILQKDIVTISNKENNTSLEDSKKISLIKNKKKVSNLNEDGESIQKKETGNNKNLTPSEKKSKKNVSIKRNKEDPYQNYPHKSQIPNQLRKQILKRFFKYVSASNTLLNKEEIVNYFEENLEKQDLKDLCKKWSQFDNPTLKNDLKKENYKKLCEKYGQSTEIKPLGKKGIQQVFFQNNEFSKVFKFLYKSFSEDPKEKYHGAEKYKESKKMQSLYMETFQGIKDYIQNSK